MVIADRWLFLLTPFIFHEIETTKSETYCVCVVFCLCVVVFMNTSTSQFIFTSQLIFRVHCWLKKRISNMIALMRHKVMTPVFCWRFYTSPWDGCDYLCSLVAVSLAYTSHLLLFIYTKFYVYIAGWKNMNLIALIRHNVITLVFCWSLHVSL